MTDSKKTETLYHPTLPSAIEVPTEKVADWTESGWRKSLPKAVGEMVGEQGPELATLPRGQKVPKPN